MKKQILIFFSDNGILSGGKGRLSICAKASRQVNAKRTNQASCHRSIFNNLITSKITSPLYQCIFITKDGATEFAKYFANHNITTLTVAGEHDRRSSEIYLKNLSDTRTSGVVEIIKAFTDVNVENLKVVSINIKLLKNKKS